MQTTLSNVFSLTITFAIFGYLLIFFYSNIHFNGNSLVRFEEPLCSRNLMKHPEWLEEIEKYYKFKAYFDCDYYSNYSIVQIEDSGNLILKESENSNGTDSISCQWAPIYRVLENEERFGDFAEIKTFPFVDWPTDTDFIVVKCNDSNGKEFSDIFSHIAQVKANSETKAINANQFNIIILGIDSTSQFNAKYRLNKTMEKLGELGAFFFNWYNRVGFNTYPNAVPLLTGKNTLSKTFVKPTYADNMSLIWDRFKEQGYATFYAEDSIPFTGIFNYLGEGFETQPTDHYGRPFFRIAHSLARDNTPNNSYGRCLQGRKAHKILWNYIKQFLRAYEIPKFVYSLVNEISHDQFSYISEADDDLVSLLEWFQEKKILENSFVFIWSDHGSRYSDANNGKVVKFYESQLPFASVIVPDKFKQMYPMETERLQFNARFRLVTSYEYHHTLMHLLCLSNNSKECLQKCKSKMLLINLIVEENTKIFQIMATNVQMHFSMLVLVHQAFYLLCFPRIEPVKKHKFQICSAVVMKSI